MSIADAAKAITARLRAEGRPLADGAQPLGKDIVEGDTGTAAQPDTPHGQA